MLIEKWPISRPLPYARNARKIPQTAIDKVAASLKEFGWRQPIVVDEEGVIVVGHTRLLAAKRLEMTEVPIHVATGLSPAQVKAYRLMDNRSHDEAKWDADLIGPEIEDLKGLDFDLSLTGFDLKEITGFLTNPVVGLTDPDATPTLGVDAVTMAGDTWALGKHRLHCGDSTVADDVAALLAGAKPHLMVTDPPYGFDYDPEWRLRDGLNKRHQKRAEGKPANDTKSDWRGAWVLFPGSIAYVWHGALHGAIVAASLESCGFQLRSQIIWAKSSLVIGRGHYHWQHEPCWYGVKKGSTATWNGDRKQSTVWSIENMHRTQGNVDDGKTAHSNQKPVECMARPMKNNSAIGDQVYDPFLGSGTTLIAAETISRVCLGMEIDPLYCDMVIKRWQQFTGGQARLEANGLGFSEVEAQRKAAV